MVVLTVAGTIIEAVSGNVESFSAGAVFYQVCNSGGPRNEGVRANGTKVGYTTMIVLIEVIIADITSLRSRLLFSYVPAIPFLVRQLVFDLLQQLTGSRSTLGSAATLVKLSSPPRPGDGA